MKQCACGLLLFVLGLLIGTAGSDDSLLKKALERESTAYSRGYTDALAKYQAVAVQAGLARWDANPHTGRRDRFIWLLPNGGDSEILNDFTGAAFAFTDRPD